mgnify:CR=1 FL=1
MRRCQRRGAQQVEAAEALERLLDGLRRRQTATTGAPVEVVIIGSEERLRRQARRAVPAQVGGVVLARAEQRIEPAERLGVPRLRRPACGLVHCRRIPIATWPLGPITADYGTPPWRGCDYRRPGVVSNLASRILFGPISKARAPEAENTSPRNANARTQERKTRAFY